MYDEEESQTAELSTAAQADTKRSFASVVAGDAAAATAAAVACAHQRHRSQDPWEAWNRLRTLCGHSTQMSVALEVTATLPPRSELDRWLGEPLRAAILPTRIFLRNAKGFPVLSARHQEFVRDLLRHKVQLVLSGRRRGRDGLTHYLQYLVHLASRMPPRTECEAFEAPYYDYLQVFEPL